MTATIADLTISSASKQYVSVPVFEASGGDPTGDAVSFAFPNPGGEPSTFVSGSWVTLNGIFYAQCLVGPSGTIQLAVGFYNTYVKIFSSPEVPVLFAGLLEVT